MADDGFLRDAAFLVDIFDSLFHQLLIGSMSGRVFGIALGTSALLRLLGWLRRAGRTTAGSLADRRRLIFGG